MRDALAYTISYLLWFLPCLFVNLYFTIKDILTFNFSLNDKGMWEAWYTITPRGFYELNEEKVQKINEEVKKKK